VWYRLSDGRRKTRKLIVGGSSMRSRRRKKLVGEGMSRRRLHALSMRERNTQGCN
jgi:hypothetical protein